MSLGPYSRPRYWTLYPPLPLKGADTEEPESFVHYLLRLAWTMGEPTCYFLDVLGGKEYRRHGGMRSVGAFCGPEGHYQDIVEAVETATGSGNLRQGTFWALNDILDGSGLSPKSLQRRWCPECYAEWDDDTSYEPLSWCVLLHTRCIRHGCLMEQLCRACNASQPVVTSYGERRRCHSCKASLGFPGAYQQAQPAERWIQTQVASIIALCGASGVRVSRYEWLRVIRMLGERAWATKSLPRTLVAEIQDIRRRAQSSRLSITTMLNVAALYGQSVRSLLEEPVTWPLLDPWKHFRCLPLPKLMGPDQPQRAARCIEIMLASHTRAYLPPLGPNLAKAFYVRREVLMAGYPHLVRSYDERYRAQGGESRRRVLRAAHHVAQMVLQTSIKKREVPATLDPLITAIQAKHPLSFEDAKRVAQGALDIREAIATARAAPARELGPLPSGLAWQKELGVGVVPWT